MRKRQVAPDRLVAEITREGALAAYTICVVLIVSGLAFIVASSDELWRRCGAGSDACEVDAASAGLVTLLSIVAIVAGAALYRSSRRRPIDPEGSSRFVVGLGVVFALGLLLLAWRIPAWTCERGRLDPVLELCLHPPASSEPSRWVPLKQVLAALAVVGGVAIATRPRWGWRMALLAVLAWAGGAGWLLVDSFVR